MNNQVPWLLFAAPLALSWTLTWVVRAGAGRFGLVDAPREDRWHRRAVPRLGGIALYLAFTVTVVVSGRRDLPALAPLLAGGAAIFLVGFLDDLLRFENRPKFILLVACAAVPVLLGVRFSTLPALIGVPLALFWILGMTNAFNWLDNMDGVAAGIAAIAALHLYALGRMTGSPFAGLPLAVAATALGFLIHNYPPARIFMGDGGSGFLGLTLATSAVMLMGSHRAVYNVLLTILAPGLILAVPIFDSALVSIGRLMHGRPVFQGGRDHPAHRFVALGLPERKAVAMLYVLSFAAGAAALLATAFNIAAYVSLCVILLLAFVALGLVLSEARVYEGTAPAQQTATVLPRPFLNKKWILVMLVDVALVSVAYVGANLLRFDGVLPPRLASIVVDTLPLVVAVKMAGLYASGIYRGTWRHVSAVDVLRLGRAATVASVLTAAALILWTRLDGVSRGALVVDWVLTLVLLGGSRMSLRFLREYLIAQAESGRRAVIIGTDKAGVLLARMLRDDTSFGLRAIGFVDGASVPRGTIICGLPVLGSVVDLPGLITRHRVQEVLVATSEPAVTDSVVAACDGRGVRVKTLEISLRPRGEFPNGERM